MSCNERTALLAKQTQHRHHTPPQQQYQQQQQQEQQLQEHHHQEQHIIVVPSGKDAKDYEPVFTTADYSYGLTLEELLPYTLDSWWQTVRWLCLSCLGVTFVLTLLVSLMMAYFHNDSIACRPNRPITTTLPPLALLSQATSSTPLLPGTTTNGTLLQLLAS